MRQRASAFPAWVPALLAATTVAVGTWLLWPRGPQAQWPTVSDRQVASAVRAAADRASRPTGVTCRQVAFAWRCLVRYHHERTATCSVGLRQRPLVNRQPRFTVIC